MSFRSLCIDDRSGIVSLHAEQIKALESFFKEAVPLSVPSSMIRFGGGTALSLYHFQHRLSFDIDLFVSDQQIMSYLNPKHWIDESHFNSFEYIDTFNHIGLVSGNNIKVDILVDSGASVQYVDDSRDVFNFDLYIESIEDIISKKIVFRKKDNKTRDIFDIATAISKDELLLQRLVEDKRISLSDLKELEAALANINKGRYDEQIQIIKPFDEYAGIAVDAIAIVSKSVRSTIGNLEIKLEIPDYPEEENNFRGLGM